MLRVLLRTLVLQSSPPSLSASLLQTPHSPPRLLKHPAPQYLFSSVP